MIKNIFRNSLLILPFALMFSCSTNKGEEDTNTDKDNLVVTTTEVKEIEYSDQHRVTGRISYHHEYKLSFKTGGIVKSIEVKEGQYVKNGMLLATIKMDEIESKTEQAELAYAKAKRDFDRATALYADSVVTLEQLQNMETQLQNAEMNVKTAVFNSKHAQVVAPANGIVQKILVQENELCSPGNPIIIFGAENQGKVLTTNVSDANVVKIGVGDKASLQFDPYPETVFSGQVLEIAGMANPTTGTYEVKIQVNDSNSHLRPGFIGSAWLQSSHTHNWMEIPVEALVFSEKRKGQVYIVEDGLAKKRAVKIERLLEDKLIISEGLSVGDKVVSSGNHRLTGDNIKITNL
ncbi:MAG: efflux RND transporter periplasmic adaptor subunit [Bacteroidetes bacterium]|nr:efflux RND transporter periplasmic adaptor subunit [Bacteroidota bacterium]MBT5527738.1 efflux RND transporter periplasmic adaptor subunit [Cytophagia bacterium]MBT3424828.1 efflux RND transporter periplasmic adaptor subunit [Bacteroidota bacterium]MBT3801580.1 efflux RND transporter periplasmic adaptor subunit [Bacteroidota bacterium]MBT3934121.1 efflux RND transporter periplasmic adaptor subunit [Bacteroidota bacterium]